MNTLATVENKPFDLSPQTFEQALTFADYLAESDLVPKDFKGKAGNCLIAMQWGAELGLKPLQALQNLAVINGRPSLWGDAVLALVIASPLCEYVSETDDGTTATCTVKRRGGPEQFRAFSMEDAKLAGLLGKQGPWTQYPKRMRQMRARAFALRDVFPDVLRGVAVAEELMDTPTERHMGPVVEVKPTSWPADLFEQRLPEWRKAIEEGRAKVDGIIKKASSKHPLTDEQKEAIEALDPAYVKPIGKGAPPAAEPPAAALAGNDVFVPTYASVSSAIHKAADMDELAEAGDLMGEVQDAHHRRELAAIYTKRADELAAQGAA